MISLVLAVTGLLLLLLFTAMLLADGKTVTDLFSMFWALMRSDELFRRPFPIKFLDESSKAAAAASNLSRLSLVPRSSF